MVSTFSPQLRLELIGTGDQSGTWGNTTNRNLGNLLEQAIAGGVAIVHDDTPDFVLSTNNGLTDQARNMILNITGTLTAARNVVCPDSNKMYAVRNNTTGGFAITLKTALGTGVEVPNGEGRLVLVENANVVDAVLISASSLSGLLPITGGGTGAATTEAARTNLGATAVGQAVFTAVDVPAALAALGAYLNSINAQSNDYTVVTDDRGRCIPVDASGNNLTMTLLPVATAGVGYALVFFRVDNSSNTLTIDGDAAETINGATTFALSNQYDGVVLLADTTTSAWLAFPFGAFTSFLRPNVGASITADIGPTQQVLVDAATIQWNVANGASARVTIDANRVFGAPTGIVNGHTYILVVEVGAGGGHAITSWDPVFDYSDIGEPVFPTAAGSKVVLSYLADEGSLLGVSSRYPA